MKFELYDMSYVLFLPLGVYYVESKTWTKKMDGFKKIDEPIGMH
jgi:hypothetical protein